MSWGEQWSKENTIKKWLKPSRILVDLVKERKGEVFNRALDIGCGAGRHVVFLAKEGIQVVGTDFSEPGVEHCKQWLAREGLLATVEQRDMTDVPYDDGYFDLIVAYNVIYHTTLSGMKAMVRLLEDKLRPGGYLFVTLKGTKEWTFGNGEEVEPDTYLAPSKGVPIHYSTEAEIEALFPAFEIVSTTHFDYLKEKTGRHHERWELVLRKPEK